MAQIDQRPNTYQSCCRLCLCDKVEALKSVFDDGDEENGDAGNHGSLAQRIQACVSIEIHSNDKFSTLVCTTCIAKINNWLCYKDSCYENQHKLEDWLQNGGGHDNNMIEQSIQIKEEPIDEISGENDMLRVKSELIEANITPMEIEPEMPSHITSTPVDAVEGNRKCPICDKEFSSVGGKKKHMMLIHFNTSRSPIITSTSTVVEEQEEEEKSTESQSKKDQVDDSKEQDEASSTQNGESIKEQEKIEFAAGLKLLQTNETPVAFEPLSKVELSYIEKCRAMVSMYTSLVCACHNISHPNLKGLLSHLRSINIWFPCFTCYRCMITFTDRSTYTKHYYKCKEARPEIETLTILSNLRKRSDVKTRLYQNFRCTICKYIFSFHEDICKHINEEHLVGEAPFHCFCDKGFDKIEDYKEHIYHSCFVEYTCDLCQFICKSVEDFLKHAADVHDKSEGFTLLQDDNFKQRREVQAAKEAELKVFSPPAERTRRKSTFYDKSFNEETVKKESEKRPLSAPSSPAKKRRHRVPNPLSPRKNMPAKCLVCPKIYSTYNNMLRHYKTHTKEEQENGQVEEMNNEEMSNGRMYYSCPDCGGMYNEKDWIKHLGLKHEKKHQCTECNQVYHFKTELDQHRNSHLNLKVTRDSKTQSYKSEKAVLNCDICNLAFSNKTEMIEHNAQHGNMPILSPGEDEPSNKKTVFQCKACSLTFSGYFLLCEHNREFHPEVRTPQPNFPKKCKYCDKILYTGGSYAVHKATHEREGKVVLPKSEKVSKRRNSDDNDDESYHTCKKCFKVFSSRCNLRNHMKSHGIFLAPAQSKGGKRNSSGKRVLCEICHVSCENQEQLMQHHQEEHMDETEEMPSLENINGNDMIFTCDVCVATFSSKIALRRHKEKHQQETMPELDNKSEETKSKVSCKYCKISFNSILALSKHMVQEHDESKPNQKKKPGKQTKHVCSICKKQYPTVTALQAHIGWHKRGKDPSSPDKFIKTSKLTSKVQIKTEQYQCDICSTIMPNNTALQIHILEKHRNINLVPRCNICNLEFKTQNEYDTHKSFHELLERQQQQQRNKSPQKRQQALNNALGNIQLPPHITIKQEPKEKRFACSFCQAVFGKSENLTAHVRQAHKDKISAEYHCMHCDRIFESPALLNNHIKAHEKLLNQAGSSQNKKFACSICNMGFNLPKDLRLHTINAHPF